MPVRIYLAEKHAELLIQEYSSLYGRTIGKTINNSIYSGFLPNNIELLSVEANYILQQQEAGILDQSTIRQCISRGIGWLAQHPTKDCSLLRSIMLHFTGSTYLNKDGVTINEYIQELFENAKAIIREHDPDYHSVHPYLVNYYDDIWDHWENIWSEKAIYDIIAAIVFLEENQKKFMWLEAILILKRIENEVIQQYLNGC